MCDFIIRIRWYENEIDFKLVLTINQWKIPLGRFVYISDVINLCAPLIWLPKDKMLRRSNRNRKTKDSYSPESTKQVIHIHKNTNQCKISLSNSFNTTSDSEEEKSYAICIGCGEEESKGKRNWIECDRCQTWWHLKCAGINEKDSIKFTKYDIRFTCAFCVIKNQRVIKRAKNIIENSLGTISENNNSLCNNLSLSALNSQDSICEKKVDKSKTGLDENIVIIDKIESPKDFSDSREIRKEISKYPNLDKKVNFAYSLSKGGIALHFKEEYKVVQENINHIIPNNIFGGKTNNHIPESHARNRETVGYIRNIPLNCDISSIRQKIKDLTQVKIVKLQQLRYWDTKKCMPIIKIQVNVPEDLETLIKFGYFNLAHGKKDSFVERRRINKVTRCFNCHRFGHSSNKCTFQNRCINWGQEECSNHNNCSSKTFCANCKGDHKASSSKCPVYLQIVNKTKFRSAI